MVRLRPMKTLTVNYLLSVNVKYRDLDDSTSLDDISFEQPATVQRGSNTSVNLSVATTDSSSSSSGFSLSNAKVYIFVFNY